MHCWTATATHKGDPESSHCCWLCLSGEVAGLQKEVQQAFKKKEAPFEKGALQDPQLLQKPPLVSLVPSFSWLLPIV